MLTFLQNNWLDLLLIAVGLSAFVIYYLQRKEQLRSAATLIVGQIDSVEKRIAALRDDQQLGNVSVFHSKTILKDNMWEKYKHLFAKRLTRSEYELVNQFFDSAEQLERTRSEMVSTIIESWKCKIAVQNEAIGNLILDHIKGKEPLENKIDIFRGMYFPMDTGFMPDIAISSLTKNLANFSMLSGTTAYRQIQKHSYGK